MYIYIIQVPIYASYLHDAVKVYATALRQVLQERIDVRNGTAIAAKIKGRMYESESRRSVISSRTARENSVAAWRSGSGVGRINEVRRARLVLGWVTGIGRANHLSISPSHSRCKKRVLGILAISNLQTSEIY